jgi:hypothetical protein
MRVWLCVGLATAGCDDGAAGDPPPDEGVVDALIDAEVDATVEPVDLQRCQNPGTPGATASCLTPSQTPKFYVEQASLYFDTLDITAPEDAIPDYHAQVARWEWPPWLILTGYGREMMITTNLGLRDIDPSTVPERDCRFFDTQPFARCYIVFEYEGGLCPIYEEFTFNEAGETTFIEAWSDIDGLRPWDKEADPWGEAPDFPRLANRIPGLGNATGTVDLESAWIADASAADPEVADYARRAADWRTAWVTELAAAPRNFFPFGCGWEPIPEDYMPRWPGRTEETEE